MFDRYWCTIVSFLLPFSEHYLSSTRQISPELDFPCTRPWACISAAPPGLASASRPYPLLSRTRNSRSCTPSSVVGWKEEGKMIRGIEFATLPLLSLPFIPYRAEQMAESRPSVSAEENGVNREDDDASSGMRLGALTHWLACQKLLLRVTHRSPSLVNPLVPDTGHLPSTLHAQISCRVSPRDSALPLLRLSYGVGFDVSPRRRPLLSSGGLYLDRVLRGAYLKNREETPSLSLPAFFPACIPWPDSLSCSLNFSLSPI